MLVYKFGGATTRTVRGLERMRELIEKAHAEELRKLKRKRTSGGITPGVVVIVSAIGHTTRRLRSIAEDAEAGKSLFAGGTLERIIERHTQLLSSLNLSDKLYGRTIVKFHKIAKEVASLVEGVTITHELSPRTLDQFLAKGEQFATVLIAALLTKHGLPVEVCDARKMVITNANFTAAIPDSVSISEKVQERILPLLLEGKIILTQGLSEAHSKARLRRWGRKAPISRQRLSAKRFRQKKW